MRYVRNSHQEAILGRMMRAHAVGDICLVGGKGSGKSMLARLLARRLGYRLTLISMYKDMTTRDLFERRNTRSNGDTYWERSLLVQCAIEGGLAVLDGIDMVHPSVISTLQRLVQDREATLASGLRLVPQATLDAMLRRATERDEKEKGKREAGEGGKEGKHVRLLRETVFAIHPSFRIVALARSPNLRSPMVNVSGSTWLTPEVSRCREASMTHTRFLSFFLSFFLSRARHSLYWLSLTHLVSLLLSNISVSIYLSLCMYVYPSIYLSIYLYIRSTLCSSSSGFPPSPPPTRPPCCKRSPPTSTPDPRVP